MLQAGLSEQQFEDAWKCAQNWKDRMEKAELSWKGETRGGWRSALRRNGWGYPIKSEPENLLFRRVSVRRRIFGIVKESEVVLTKSDPEHTNDCKCSACTAKEKFGWKNGSPPEMYMLFEFGEIKGQ